MTSNTSVRILIVCHSNQGRSIALAASLNRLADMLGIPLTADSAGVAYSAIKRKRCIPLFVRRALRDLAVPEPPADRRPRYAGCADPTQYDHVIAVGDEIAQTLATICPAIRHTIEVVPIEDPHPKTRAGCRRCFREAKALADQLARRYKAQLVNDTP